MRTDSDANSSEMESDASNEPTETLITPLFAENTFLIAPGFWRYALCVTDGVTITPMKQRN